MYWSKSGSEIPSAGLIWSIIDGINTLQYMSLRADKLGIDLDDKKDLSEIDICDLFITPAIKEAGWDQLS